MPKAVGRVLAESNQTLEVDGYTYFPPEAVRTEYLIPSETTSVWKIHRCGFSHNDQCGYPKPPVKAKKRP